MNNQQLDHLTTDFVVGSRRRVVVGLAALALGGAGVFGQALHASAETRHQCVTRCFEHRNSKQQSKQKRHACHRQCQGKR